jgi:hypothetical protein
MEYQCNHILTKGNNKDQRCTKIAWFPFFYRCFCKQHAIMYNIPVTPEETNLFINDVKTNRER